MSAAEIPSAEVVVERLRMALAEAGYPDAEILNPGGSFQNGWPITYSGNRHIPRAVEWVAAYMAYEAHYACWSCSVAQSVALECIAGNCAHPEGPARPPRELLRAS